MAKSFGNTWWGNYWLKSLDNIDYENRLQRGKAYARAGNVKDIKIKGNVIAAKVAGSRPRPYTVTVIIPPFFEEQVGLLMKEIIARPALISKLLNRELDPDILAIAEKLGLKVFPRQWTDFKMQCNCPDWAVPCKHLAAVIYMVSMAIDNNPFLVFEMHNVNLLDELKKRGIAIETKGNTEIPLFNDLLIRKPTKELTILSPVFQRIDFSILQDIAEPLIQLLPVAPPFYNNGDFQEIYRAQLLRVVRCVQRIFKKNLEIGVLFKGGVIEKTVSRHSDLSIKIHNDITWSITYQENSQSHKAFPIFTQDELLQALLKLNPDLLPDYQPSIIGLHQALFCALHLLAHGAVVPQIVVLENKKHAIRWLPALIDPQVHSVLTQLNDLLPDRLIETTPVGRKLSIYHKNQSECLVSLFLNKLIASLSDKTDKDEFLELFFGNLPQAFSGVGQQEVCGGIKVWLDRYYLTSKQYRPVFLVQETKDDKFLLHIQIEDMSRPDAEAATLKEVLCADSFRNNRFQILRELTLLSSFVKDLNGYINQEGATPIQYENREFAPFLMQILPAIRLLNIQVLLPKSLQYLLRPQATLRIKKKSSEEGSFIRLDEMLSFDWQVAVGDDVISPEEFKRLMQNASGLIKFKQSYIYVDETDIERLHKLFTKDPSMSSSQLLHKALLEEHESAPIVLTDEVRALIKEFTSQEIISLPQDLNAQLRPYQERGFSWMYRNIRIGFGSILADDMGLGKTIQVITLLLKIKEEGLMQKEKVLIVTPTGLLTNWQAEIEKFAPSLTSFTYHGAARDLKQFNADIMLTTYGVLRSDEALLKKKKWQIMVIDEAQNIKNHDTGQSKAVRSIPAGTHIALSGTPVENRLSEFWSIMDFANKGYLGSIKNFKEEYAQPIQVFNDMQCVTKFRKVTAPFMMRRLKSDKSIIADLPDKIEQNEYALLTQSQAALYEKTVQIAMDAIEGYDDTDEKSLFVRQGLVLQMILALKQICNHPTQFLKNGQFNPSLSGKTEMLLDLIESIVDSGEKVLIFTQFREMGDMLQRFLTERLGEQPMFYHGGSSLKERQTMVERFQNNKADKVFLLSLKAAGTGLNLTAASHVVHYDLWWNPAVETQATDRAYRIGQNKNVIVHRFITKNTFEERIDAMIQKKKNLADLTVTTGEGWIGKLSNKELREIF